MREIELQSKNPAKGCVFCGKELKCKTKEHVLPKWLIKVTGNPRRLAIFGGLAISRKSFAFASLTFPACDQCNNNDQKLENQTKGIFKKLWCREVLSEQECEILLDWMDKVRVGLWLGGLMLSKNPYSIDPHFRISQRIAYSDRLLYIGMTDDPSLRLNTHAIDDPVFMCSPSFGSIYANGLALVSFSAIGIAAKHLGLPYWWQTGTKIVDGKCMQVVTLKQAESLRGGPGWLAYDKAFSIIAQAIYPSELIEDSESLKEMETLGIVPGSRSRVSIVKGVVIEQFAEKALNILPKPTPSREELFQRHIILRLKLRDWIARRLPKASSGEPLYAIHRIGQVFGRKRRQRIRRRRKR